VLRTAEMVEEGAPDVVRRSDLSEPPLRLKNTSAAGGREDGVDDQHMLPLAVNAGA
jgi:hypothetical protein